MKAKTIWKPLILMFFFGMVVGGFLTGAKIIDNQESYTLIKNQSNDWYWLENQEYTQTSLNNYYKLKNILIVNECSDGGFIEETDKDGNDFLIVCYQPTKILNEVKQ